MFEITSEDIALLDDKNLRSLVALLCEAEVKACKFSTSAITWGGDQNAKDGGVDVRVELPKGNLVGGYIPRETTGFQVKRQDMPRKAIVNEMAPGGVLRPVIATLGKTGGAYIIVSSKGAVSDSALATRKAAMQAAVSGLDSPPMVDFFDRTRIASWVRNHAGIILWVREAIRKPISGWEPFKAWSYPEDGESSEYLTEKGVGLRDKTTTRTEEMSLLAGLDHCRKLLSEPKSTIRLVGLSGVGKTRFVQALFDERVGTGVLDSSHVVYTNISNEPVPSPFTLASDLIAQGAKAILVIDNCSSDLHGRLASLIKGQSNSKVSLITIEYDISDDLPDETEVLELRATSVELVEKLLRVRFPNLSGINITTAANFSGGNARVAIALANTAKKNGSLWKLDDRKLFERLVLQRKSNDKCLLEISQACSLVYSFDGENTSDSEEAELHRLGALVGQPVEKVFSTVSELMRRDLAQRRGVWRAVLPHAIANRLATAALQDIPSETVEKWLVVNAPDRLTISFAKRLGLLVGSAEASLIVSRWLAADGWIGKNIWQLNDFGIKVLVNALPANIIAGLDALEKNIPSENSPEPYLDKCEYLPSIIRSIAWDASLFKRCMTLLHHIAICGETSIAKKATEIHVSMFPLYLSGTHASIEQRIEVIRELFSSSSSRLNKLGITSLGALLQNQHFSSSYDFQFGGNARDYGYMPHDMDAVTHWYKTVMKLSAELCVSESNHSGEVRELISRYFPSLWSQVALRADLVELLTSIANRKFWAEGWLAARRARYFQRKTQARDEHLSDLIDQLAPTNLIENVIARVFSTRSFDYDDLEMENGSYSASLERQNAEIYDYGIAVAEDSAALASLMPKIVGRIGNCWEFGRGLAAGAVDVFSVWEKMTQCYADTSVDSRGTGVLTGFISYLSYNKSDSAERLLDDAAVDVRLEDIFPYIQAAARPTSKGFSRLCQAIKSGTAPIEAYSQITVRVGDQDHLAPEIAKMIALLGSMPNGKRAALHQLFVLSITADHDKKTLADEIKAAARNLLATIEFGSRSHHDDYELESVVKTCATGEGAVAFVEDLCLRLRRSMMDGATYSFYNTRILTTLMDLLPMTVIETLLSGDDSAVQAGIDLLREDAGLEHKPMQKVSADTLLNWCRSNSSVNRYKILAAILPLFEETQSIKWSEISTRLIFEAPSPKEIFAILTDRLRPSTYSGALSTILGRNADLLGSFDTHGNQDIEDAIRACQQRLRNEAREELAWESRRDRRRDERFE